MKKFLTFTTLILASTVLVACSSNKTSSSSSSSKSKTSQGSSSVTSSSSDRSSKTTSSSAVQGMNLEQIATGDFSSIQGTWKNNAGQSFIITGDQYSNPATGYIGTLKVFVDDYGINLGAYKNGIPMQLAIVPIPAGTEISGSMFGSDYSLSDQSDLTRDRFVVSPNGISSVDTKTLVYYKQ